MIREEFNGPFEIPSRNLETPFVWFRIPFVFTEGEKFVVRKGRGGTENEKASFLPFTPLSVLLVLVRYHKSLVKNIVNRRENNK